MRDGTGELEIKYRLVKVTSEKSKDGHFKYRAVTKHDPINMESLAKSKDSLLMAHTGSTHPMLAIQDAYRVLEAMVEGVLRDGRTRRLGDYLEIRGDIRGSFDSPDEKYDPEKHTFALNVQLLKGFDPHNYKRFTNPKLDKDA